MSEEGAVPINRRLVPQTLPGWTSDKMLGGAYAPEFWKHHRVASQCFRTAAAVKALGEISALLITTGGDLKEGYLKRHGLAADVIATLHRCTTARLL